MLTASAEMTGTAGLLSTWHMFVWGAAGALICLLAVEGIPLSRRLAVGELEWRPDPWRCIGALTFVVCFLAVGGGVAILVGGATEPKHAVCYGLAWQGILSGYLRSTLGSPDRSAH
jgi:hypothetical protein